MVGCGGTDVSGTGWVSLICGTTKTSIGIDVSVRRLDAFEIYFSVQVENRNRCFRVPAVVQAEYSWNRRFCVPGIIAVVVCSYRFLE